MDTDPVGGCRAALGDERISVGPEDVVPLTKADVGSSTGIRLAAQSITGAPRRQQRTGSAATDTNPSMAFGDY